MSSKWRSPCSLLVFWIYYYNIRLEKPFLHVVVISMVFNWLIWFVGFIWHCHLVTTYCNQVTFIMLFVMFNSYISELICHVKKVSNVHHELYLYAHNYMHICCNFFHMSFCSQQHCVSAVTFIELMVCSLIHCCTFPCWWIFYVTM